MQDFRKLKVWQKSHELVLLVYQATANFPDEERFGLVNQLRRAAVSIPSNLAEGSGRNSSADFARFLHMGMGSAREVEYQLQLAHDLDYLDEPDYQQLHAQVIEVQRMLAGFLKSLNG